MAKLRPNSGWPKFHSTSCRLNLEVRCEAVQQTDGLLETLSRAYGDNAVVRWFGDVDPADRD